jgi:hypothetical protein
MATIAAHSTGVRDAGMIGTLVPCKGVGSDLAKEDRGHREGLGRKGVHTDLLMSSVAAGLG